MFIENTGPRDRRPVELRDDVLVFSSDPLEPDPEVTGPIGLTLHAASSAPDTDFTATLVDVHPGGKAICISEGIVRIRSDAGGRDGSLLLDEYDSTILMPTGTRSHPGSHGNMVMELPV